MKTLKSYVKFITEASSEPIKPLAEVWQQIYKELSPKAHKKKGNMILSWGENAKRGGQPGTLGFSLSSEANRIIVWCDEKQRVDIEKKVAEDIGNLTRVKGDGNTYIIYEYEKNDAATPVVFANYIIDELKPEDPNKVDAEKPSEEKKPQIPAISLDKPLPELWAEMSKDLSKIGQAKATPMSIVWGEHKKRTAERNENAFGITMSKEVNKIFITCGFETFPRIKEIINQHPELKIVKETKPTKGMYAEGGKIQLQYPGNDGATPTMFITQVNNEIGF
jgi:hypothetical protein